MEESIAYKELKRKYPWMGSASTSVSNPAVVCAECHTEVPMLRLNECQSVPRCPRCDYDGISEIPKDEGAVEVPAHKLHDDHYADKGIEPILVQEQVMNNEGIPRPAVLHVAQAVRYILRAGTKKGEPWEKDIEKAFNYLHRALKGTWLNGR